MKSSPVVLWLLGIALIAGPMAAATSSTPLFEIYSVRFIKDSSGQPILDQGRLTAEGEFKHYLYSQLAAGTNVPPEAFDRDLLPLAVFPAYDVLGIDALANFKVAGSVTVAGGQYFVMQPADHPKLDVGSVTNLSARGIVEPAHAALVGGFVVADHPRRVLLRAVGPSLGGFGVTVPLSNPVITLYRLGDSTAVASNDDWGQQANASDIASAATTVGAFPLSRTSQDAALLLELPSGAYTAQVSSADIGRGTALLEIYVLP